MNSLHKHLLATLMLFSVEAALALDEGTSAEEHKNILVPAQIFAQTDFASRFYGEGDMNGTLAMNINYAPVVSVRAQIESQLYGGASLLYLTAWEAEGEAHVTTISPIEYQNCMWSLVEGRERRVIHMREIDEIALKHDIQGSDLTILGMGHGEKSFDETPNKLDETHFIIVQSDNLLRIRHAVNDIYLERGGDAECWDPEFFFPHITVGYTRSDIHYPDVKKDMLNSEDKRFSVVFSRN